MRAYAILIALLLGACTTPKSVLESAVEAGCKLKQYEVNKQATKVYCAE